MKIGICGICGRMGIAILELALERGHELTAAFDSASSPCIGRDVNTLVHGNPFGITIKPINAGDAGTADCILDFSSPEATMQLIPCLVEHGKGLIVGTTGFSSEQVEKIKKASEKIPVVFSPNMAVGVNVLFKLTEMAAGALNEFYDVEILESHHRLKKDAPSGTAKHLAEIVKNNMAGMEDAQIITGRDGLVGERTNKEIAVMALRGGDIVGEHTVYFIGQGERIELTIRSSNRETLSRGAVLAAEFLKGKGAGLYSMYDVLGL